MQVVVVQSVENLWLMQVVVVQSVGDLWLMKVVVAQSVESNTELTGRECVKVLLYVIACL